jgi:hypothetical protein
MDSCLLKIIKSIQLIRVKARSKSLTPIFFVISMATSKLYKSCIFY